MESSKNNDSAEGDSPEALPSLIQAINALEVVGFDRDRDNLHRLSNMTTFGIEAASKMDETDLSKHRRNQSISISMPSSPVESHSSNTKKVLFRDDTVSGNEIPSSATTYENFRSQTKKAKCYSQPMPKGSIPNEVVKSANFPILPPSYPRSNKMMRDNRFDSFKTWSGKLERQISVLRGKRKETEQSPTAQQPPEMDTLPVDRYFDALEGPELDTLRDTEESVLPDDKTWPFLLRFPISSFGICLGVSSQAIMWKTLASVNSSKFLHIHKGINLVFWLISVALVVIIFITYILKLIFYFEAVRREYYHPIRINFFFAPWIALLFLALGVPPSITTTLPESLWYVLMFPFLCLELKIYGQWMSGGQRRLSKVATPVNHLSVVGNFVGALLGASMGLKEGPLFFFAVGLVHYIVLFVTLYQRLPSNETLPKELHPVFFLFVAAPSVASMAWARIQGSFDNGSRIAYFIAMFLYFSLAVRINFFRGIRFSLTWWAYTFPMTGAAIATIRYSDAVTNPLTKTLAVLLCLIATLTVAALFVTTIIYAVILGELFPNDIAIAISDRKPIKTRKWYHRRGGSADTSIEQYLKYACSDGKDVEAGVSPSNKECSNGHGCAEDAPKHSRTASDST